jgi:hypothetical protein
MTRYKITADNLNRALLIFADTEDEAWRRANDGYHNATGGRLLNGNVTPIMEEAEKDARIAELEEANAKLRAALKEITLIAPEREGNGHYMQKIARTALT